MNPTRVLRSDRYSRELNLLEQVHLALGSASKLDDFYLIMVSLLVDPNAYGFSRAFFLRYDDRTRSFQGKLALGPSSAAEHHQFRRDLMEETLQLRSQFQKAYRENSDMRLVQQLYNLRFHSLWINLVQGNEEGTGLNSMFQLVNLELDQLPPQHLLHQVVGARPASIYTTSAMDLTGLVDFIEGPVIAGALASKSRLHGVLVSDLKFEPRGPDSESLFKFQALMNHATVLLDNVELVEELTALTTRLQDLDRLKSNFLSIVSHELRTPLTSIIGFAQLLVNGKVGHLTPSQLDLLKRVSGHAAHLHSMVNDLLEIAEVESGGILNVQLAPVDPLEVLMNVIPKLDQRRANRKVDIEPRISGTVPKIRTDDGALDRIYYHLLDNAVKFIPSVGKVTIEFKEVESDLEITIADSGIGISEENLKRIFEYFYQVDFRLQRNYSGMGIGLTVVKLLLDATGGLIRVESVPGSGSRFTLRYPIATEA